MKKGNSKLIRRLLKKVESPETVGNGGEKGAVSTM